MTKMVLAICGERYEEGWHVRRFAYLGEAMEHDRPKDGRYVMQLIERLNNSEGNGPSTSWMAGEPPKDYARFFDVYIFLENQGKDNAYYKADYHSHPHCPSQAIDEGMEIYRAIRKEGIRPAVKQLNNVRKMKEAQRNAELLQKEMQKRKELAFPKFEVGRMYYYNDTDSFGHIEMGMVKVNALMPNENKAVVDVAGGRKRVVVEIKRDEQSEFFRLKKMNVTIRANCTMEGKQNT